MTVRYCRCGAPFVVIDGKRWCVMKRARYLALRGHRT